MKLLGDVMLVVLTGVGATAVMDLWLLVLRRAGVRTLDFALMGRWVGYMGRGRFAHAALAKAAALPAELALGWATHYAVGIAFAALLAGIEGVAWFHHPSWAPALVIGASTVVAPLFVMQPAMGAGFAGSRTPAPLRNCLRSLANHTVFGVGLYASAALLQRVFA